MTRNMDLRVVNGLPFLLMAILEVVWTQGCDLHQWNSHESRNSGRITSEASYGRHVFACVRPQLYGDESEHVPVTLPNAF